MGTYFHPGNSGFQRVSEKDYVDKTEMIGIVNRTIGTMNNLTCVSRPRRFGKSFFAQMLCAYYDKSCDSHELFKGYKISNDPTYENNLNKYHVISIDVSGFIANAKKKLMPLKMIPTVIETASKPPVYSMKNFIEADQLCT